MLVIYPSTNEVLYKALWLPLHIGVIVFVLLSGYFSIKASSKGFIKLFGIFFVYNLSELIWNVCHSSSLYEAFHSLLFLSNTHFWFVKIYLFLYLLSPIVNKFLQSATDKQVLYIFICLWFVSQYMGMTGGDTNMIDGKNVTNFIFLYTVGHCLSRFKMKWQQIFTLKLVLLYIALNIIIVVAYYFFHERYIGQFLWTCFFNYSGFGLLINSVLIFMIVGKHSFQSRVINYLAESSLAIYLIHGNRPYVVGLWSLSANQILRHTDNTILVLLECFLLTLLIIAFCIMIDKMLFPVWKGVNRIGLYVYNKLVF